IQDEVQGEPDRQERLQAVDPNLFPLLCHLVAPPRTTGRRSTPPRASSREPLQGGVGSGAPVRQRPPSTCRQARKRAATPAACGPYWSGTRGRVRGAPPPRGHFFASFFTSPSGCSSTRPAMTIPVSRIAASWGQRLTQRGSPSRLSQRSQLVAARRP